MLRPWIFLAAVLLALSCAPRQILLETPLDVMATVGSVQITRFQVERMMAGLDRVTLSPSELQQEAIEELIAQELLYQEAQRRAIQVTEAELTGQLELLKREFISRGALEELQQENTLNEPAVREQMRRDLMIARLLDQEVYAKTTVQDHEMVQRPPEVHELYIFRRIYPGAPEARRQDAWEKMRQAREKLLAGADFRQVVEEYSQSGLAKYGGDAGLLTFSPNNELSRVLFSLEEGQISEIIETRWGLYILKAEDIPPQRMQTFGELSPKLQRIVLQGRMRERLDEFVEELKRKTDVETVS